MLKKNSLKSTFYINEKIKKDELKIDNYWKIFNYTK